MNTKRLLVTLAAGAVMAASVGLLDASEAAAGTVNDIASIAGANLGKGYCSTNSAGGSGFASSCSGEEWCSDFARWVWQQAGASDVSRLTAGAGSFALYGAVGTTPHVGDAVLFGYNGQGWAEHVEIVTAVNANGTVNLIGGNERANSSTSSLVAQDVNVQAKVGSTSTGQTLSGYVSPRGVSGGGGGVAPTGETFHNTLQKSTASWIGAGVLSTQQATQVATAAMPDGSLHVDTLVNGNVYDYIRSAGGTWIGPNEADMSGHTEAIALAGMANGDLHLETLYQGNVWDNALVKATGRWTGSSEVDHAGHTQAIAIAGLPNGDLHLETLYNGNVWDNALLKATGSWTGSAISDGAGHTNAIAITGMSDGTMHVETLYNGNVWDHIRKADGNWLDSTVVDAAAHTTGLAVAGMPDGSMHLETLYNGNVWDNVLKADGNWANSAVADGAGHTVMVSTSGAANGDLEMNTLG